MKTSETLYKAGDLIQRDGWWQDGVDFHGPVGTCAANAIRTVGGVSYGPAHIALIAHIGGTGGLGAIYRWNDAPDRTAAEVVETLRAAAVIAAARELVAAYTLGAVGA